MPTENPILNWNRAIPFHEIEPAHVIPAMREALRKAEEQQQVLLAPGSAEPGDILGALDELTETVAAPYRIIRHLTGVANSPEMRAAFAEVQPEVVAFEARLLTNERLYGRLKRFAASEEGRSLTGTASRHLTKTLERFRRAGADLSGEAKARASELQVRLAALSTRFSENVLDATNAYELRVDDPARLAGLPQSSLDQARAAAKKKGFGGYLFTLHAPSFTPFMKHVHDRELRRELHEAYFAVGGSEPHDNRPILNEILELRQERAQLLGYADHADYMTETRMVSSGNEAAAFMRKLTERTAPYFEAEVKELEAFAASELGITELQAWDISYALERLKKARHDLNEEELRPYFPLDTVMGGLFTLAERLFGVRVERAAEIPTWHAEVEAYRATHEDGTHLGLFYTDWFPRAEKRGGAWMSGLVTGGPTDEPEPGGFEPHVGVIAANFTPPEGSAPALLTHSEVQTLFHEFGHLLHHLTSRVKIRARSSMSVAWDFVELPSQLLENWTWEREGLNLIARHVDTHEPLPEELYERLLSSRTFAGAYSQMRQLSFGVVDLALHREYRPSPESDPVAFANRVMAPFAAGAESGLGSRMTRFTHIFAGGYACGYYSYKWSEVLDADAFSRFKEEGIFNEHTGRELVSKILAKGDSEDPSVLFRDFLGRDPDLSALIRRNLGEPPKAPQAG